MAKFIPFQNLVAVLKDKLGVDMTEEVEKAYQTDLAALREGIATKSDDARLTAMAAEISEVKTAVLAITETLSKLTPTIEESVKAIKLEPATITMPSEYEQFVVGTTTALTAVQTALKEVLERLAQPQTKSEPIFQGINSGKATEALMAAITATNQKAESATKSLFPNSTISWDK